MTAQRRNEGKIRLDLIPALFERLLGELFTKGAAKYADWNWAQSLNIPGDATVEGSHEWFKTGCMASLKRHRLAYDEGEIFDPETKLPHMAHVAWNALAIAYYDFYDKRDDDKTLFINFLKE